MHTSTTCSMGEYMHAHSLTSQSRQGVIGRALLAPVWLRICNREPARVAAVDGTVVAGAGLVEVRT
jgi:hypothetical protein